MSKLMWISGILLIAAGVAFGAVNLVSIDPAAAKISLDTSAILLVGGILALGLGSVVDALSGPRPALVERAAATAAVLVPAAEAVEAAAEISAAETVEAAADAAEVSEPTRSTINALEQARQKMEQAFEPQQDTAEQPGPADDAASEAAEEAIAEDDAVEEDEVIEDGQLYVVEERFIRLRPARILSDGTVEAETDEGWMRFENLEHLDEYLDALDMPKA